MTPTEEIDHPRLYSFNDVHDTEDIVDLSQRISGKEVWDMHIDNPEKFKTVVIGHRQELLCLSYEYAQKRDSQNPRISEDEIKEISRLLIDRFMGLIAEPHLPKDLSSRPHTERTRLT